MALNFQQKQKSKIFNLKTLLVTLVVLILFISVPVFAVDEKDGRYKGYVMGDRSAKFIILDTKTGEIKWCIIQILMEKEFKDSCTKPLKWKEWGKK